MNLFRRLARGVSPVILAAFGLMCLHVPAVQAGMIAPSTYAAQQAPDVAEKRAELRQVLERDDVRAQLIALGVDPLQAQARVDSLSDQEVLTLSEQMPDLPAGGIIGAIVFIFLVLLITDLLGLTDVYPFVKKR